MFEAEFEVLLYDFTRTYFECDPPEAGERKYGHSRDKRPGCVQVVIALVITTDGFPLAYEVMDGNTSDKTTLKAFLSKIEAQYGRAKRTRVMDRGIPTEGDRARAGANPLSRGHAARPADEARAEVSPVKTLAGRARQRAGQARQGRG